MSLALIASSCSDRSESEITDNIVNSTKNNVSSKKPTPVASFAFDLGRKSNNCKGRGICELAAFGISIVSPPKPKAIMNITLYSDSETPQYRAVYELDSELQIDDTTFYVDEDFYGVDEENNKYKIHQGNYDLDPEIGIFGGYSIIVTKL